MSISIRHGNDSRGESLTPIFIGGTGRSGTTILFKLLRHHPQIASLSKELRIIVDPGGAIDLIDSLSDNWSPYRADDAIRRFMRCLKDVRCTNRLKTNIGAVLRRVGASAPRYCGLGHGQEFGLKTYDALCRELFTRLVYHSSRGSWVASPPWHIRSSVHESAPLSRASACRIVERFFDALYQNMGKMNTTHWIDSTPYSLLHVNRLCEIFPEARFVHVHRDPRDVLSSYLTKAWGGNNALVVARRIAGVYQKWLEIRRALPPETYLEVSLESLTNDSTRVASQVLQFSGLEENELPHSIVSNRRSNHARWKTDIPAKTLPAVMEILGPAIVQFGYQDDIPHSRNVA